MINRNLLHGFLDILADRPAKNVKPDLILIKAFNIPIFGLIFHFKLFLSHNLIVFNLSLLCLNNKYVTIN